MSNQYEVRVADISQWRMITISNTTTIGHGPTELDEAELVSMAKSGNGEAFVVLSKLHSRKILPTIFKITRNWHDAEDALQDAMLRAFSHLKDFQEKCSFSTWLTRIAINSALMILRKKRGLYEIPFDGTGDSGDNYERREVKSASEDPESRLARKEREELLKTAVLQLPHNLREVVDLRLVKGYSTREIAQALGISVPAVKSRLARARSNLRTALVPPNFRSERRLGKCPHRGILQARVLPKPRAPISSLVSFQL
jgi:RNA polymerase sigma-70 factor (ECF subfamily)